MNTINLLKKTALTLVVTLMASASAFAYGPAQLQGLECTGGYIAYGKTAQDAQDVTLKPVPGWDGFYTARIDKVDFTVVALNDGHLELTITDHDKDVTVRTFGSFPKKGGTPTSIVYENGISGSLSCELK